MYIICLAPTDCSDLGTWLSHRVGHRFCTHINGGIIVNCCIVSVVM
jgi:hypothetical protein